LTAAAAAAALASIPTPPRLVPVFIAFFLDAVGTGEWERREGRKKG
jgi:hypothetical protein